MPGKDDNGSGASSPLIRAITGVAIQPPTHATGEILRSGAVSPWRKNLEESIRTCVPDNVKRGGLGDKLNAIERAAGNKEDLVLARINAVCQQKVSPLGQDAVCSFFDAMFFVSVRARKEFPDEPKDSAKNSENTEKRAKLICGYAEKFGAIAENVSSERVFCLVCLGMERIRDFRVTSKYINYMLSASGQIKSEKNPEGIIKDADKLGFYAKFIAERSDGTNASYVDGLITKLIMDLNEPGSGTP